MRRESNWKETEISNETRRGFSDKQKKVFLVNPANFESMERQQQANQSRPKQWRPSPEHRGV